MAFFSDRGRSASLSSEFSTSSYEDDVTQACCHEAGHAVAALLLDFTIKKIEVNEGIPRTVVCDWDSPKHKAENRFLVLAGGLAAEEEYYDEPDKEAARLDQKMISDLGGKSIEQYTPQAWRVICSQKEFHKSLRGKLRLTWLANTAGVAPDPSLNTFLLMSGSELMDEWGKWNRATN
jgi:hypothetical protein